MDDPKLNLQGADSVPPARPKPEHLPSGKFAPGNVGGGRIKGRPNFWTEFKRAIKQYRGPGGKRFFQEIVARAAKSDHLAKVVLDKLFDDATVPKGIDLTMVQGVGTMETVVKDLAAQREARARAAVRIPLEGETPEEDEP